MKKIVLVTGATSGIGEACARVFARGGYDVIVTGRRAERLEALRKELETLGAAVKTLQFDVRDAEAAKNALASPSPSKIFAREISLTLLILPFVTATYSVVLQIRNGIY